MASAVYSDGSGSSSDPNQPIHLIAGFHNSVDNWVHFGSKWQAFLDRRHIDCLHQSASAESWKSSEAKQTEVNLEAAQIIRSSGATPLAYFTVSQDFRQWALEHEDKGTIDGFAFNSFRFIVHALGWCDDPPKRSLRPPEFVFESSGKTDHRALRDVIASYGLPEPIFREEKAKDPTRTIVALQAADLLAYEIYQGWKDLLVHQYTDRPVWHQLASLPESSIGWADKTRLDELIPQSQFQLRLERIARGEE